MTYQKFIREFAPIIQVYGAQHFPDPILERAHYKIKDFSDDQMVELRNLILDMCEFAPKVPKIIELANIVRARHREGIANITTDNDSRTPEVQKDAIAKLRLVMSQIKSSRGV